MLIETILNYISERRIFEYPVIDLPNAKITDSGDVITVVVTDGCLNPACYPKRSLEFKITDSSFLIGFDKSSEELSDYSATWPFFLYSFTEKYRKAITGRLFKLLSDSGVKEIALDSGYFGECDYKVLCGELQEMCGVSNNSLKNNH